LLILTRKGEVLEGKEKKNKIKAVSRLEDFGKLVPPGDPDCGIPKRKCRTVWGGKGKKFHYDFKL